MTGIELKETKEELEFIIDRFYDFPKETNVTNSINNIQNAIKAINELEDYYAIGTVEECRESMERQRAKKPVKIENNGFRYTDSYICPNCEKGFTGTGIADFCYHCGQALSWECDDE